MNYTTFFQGKNMQVTINTKGKDFTFDVDKYKIDNGFLCLHNAKAVDVDEEKIQRLYIPVSKITTIEVNGIEDENENTDS